MAKETQTFGILLEEVDLTASFTWSDSAKVQQKNSSFEISLHAAILLTPNTEPVSIFSTGDDTGEGGVIADGQIPRTTPK